MRRGVEVSEEVEEVEPGEEPGEPGVVKVDTGTVRMRQLRILRKDLWSAAFSGGITAVGPEMVSLTSARSLMSARAGGAEWEGWMCQSAT